MPAALFPADPTPSPSGAPNQVTPLHVENWFQKHGSLLIGHGVQILGIVLACVVIRMLLRKSINRVVRHTTRIAERDGGERGRGIDCESVEKPSRCTALND